MASGAAKGCEEDALPVTPTSKIEKYKLRAALLAELDAEKAPSLSNVIHTPDFFSACLFRACRQARKPI